MKKFLQLSAVTLSLIAFSATAFAMDLGTAKSSGLVGERENGLIGAVLPNPSPEVMDLVNTTNSGRMAVYKQTAADSNIPLKEVQAIAAQKIYGAANTGDFLQVHGKWTQK